MKTEGTYTRTLDIRTAEGVDFSIPLAGPVARFLAWGIDVAGVAVILMAVTQVIQPFALLSPDIAMALLLLAQFVVRTGYAIALEWLWNGQTLGKRMLRLHVADENGLPLRFSQVVVRNLLRIADALPVLYLVGGAACVLSPRAQRLGDLVAGTVVAREAENPAPDLGGILGDRYNSFRDFPHIAARLRNNLSPAAARIGLQALRRRNRLDPDARVALFAEVAAHYRSLATFPEEATVGMSDEQYVRNALDVTLRTRTGASISQ